MKRKTSKSKASNRGSAKRKFVAPKTAEQLYAMPERMQRIYMAMLTLVALVRGGFSLARAMRHLKLTRAQVDGFAHSAFRKLNNGRYVAKAYDHLLRVVMVVSEDGLREVATRDSREASKAGSHSSAVHRYFRTGDDSWVRQFEAEYVLDVKGEKVPLLTDLEELDELGNAGVISFEYLYANS